MNDPFFFKWQKKLIRWRLFRYAVYFLFVGLFVGIGLGYAWRMVQTETETHLQIQKLKDHIIYFESHWTPIREKEVKASKNRK